MERLRNRYNFDNIASSGSGIGDLTSSASFGSFGGGHGGGYGYCCENGVDFGTLAALLAGKTINYWQFHLVASIRLKKFLYLHNV